jgi:4-hydroxy 2-oxovalerate aldolase
MNILDCTLRDGGYYTGWDFPEELLEVYLHSMAHLPVTYVELGYRSAAKEKYLGEFYYLPIYRLKKIKNLFPQLRLALMLNAKECTPKMLADLTAPCRPYVEMIRIATAPDKIEGSLKLAVVLKKQGFKVAFNIMYLSKLTEENPLFDQLEALSEYVDVLYLIDSYGGALPDFVERIFRVVRKKCDIPLGFHGHNNIEMAFSNSLAALKAGAQYVDTTVLGMGRGAGNLRTELFLTHLRYHGAMDVDLNLLSKVVEAFAPLHQQHGWGSNFPYAIAGSYGLPQATVMKSIQKRRYSIEQVVSAQLETAENNSSVTSYPSVLAAPFANVSVETIIIIGGGKTAHQNFQALEQYVNTVPAPLVIFSSIRHFSSFKFTAPQLLCLTGHEGDGWSIPQTDFPELFLGAVIPASPRPMGTRMNLSLQKKVYELQSSRFTQELKDSPLAISLDLAELWPNASIKLVGFDGYSDTKGDLTLHQETQQIIDIAAERAPAALTKTRYKRLIIESVYREIRNV